MTAVIAFADGDTAGIEQGQGCMEGGEAGRVTNGGTIEEGRENSFEASRVRRRGTGVDVGSGIKPALHSCHYRAQIL